MVRIRYELKNPSNPLLTKRLYLFNPLHLVSRAVKSLNPTRSREQQGQVHVQCALLLFLLSEDGMYWVMAQKQTEGSVEREIRDYNSIKIEQQHNEK